MKLITAATLAAFVLLVGFVIWKPEWVLQHKLISPNLNQPVNPDERRIQTAPVYVAPAPAPARGQVRQAATDQAAVEQVAAKGREVVEQIKSVPWAVIISTAIVAALIGMFAWQKFVDKKTVETWEKASLFRDDRCGAEGWIDCHGNVIESWIVKSKEAPPWAGRLPVGFETRMFVRRFGSMTSKHIDEAAVKKAADETTAKPAATAAAAEAAAAGTPSPGCPPTTRIVPATT